MSIESTTNTRADRYAPSSGVKNSIYEIGISAGAGALAGWVFGIIDPVGGAVFGASYALTSTIGNAIYKKLGMNQTALKIAAALASFAISAGVGIFVATTVGFPVTVLGGIGMVLVMTITSIAVRIVIKGAAHLSACAAGAALAVKERFC